MFFSPPTTVVIQGNSQNALNAQALTIGGRQTNNQIAVNSARVRNLGVILGGG